MPSENIDVTLAGGGRSKAGFSRFNPNLAHDLSGEFSKIQTKNELLKKGYTITENEENRLYKVVRSISQGVPTIKVFVLLEHITREKFIEDLKAEGREADYYARTSWGLDIEMTKKLLEQCDYLLPKEPEIILMPNGKFECRAKYVIDGKELTFRIDEIERRPSNIKLNKAECGKLILEQLANSENGLSEKTRRRIMPRKK